MASPKYLKNCSNNSSNSKHPNPEHNFISENFPAVAQPGPGGDGKHFLINFFLSVIRQRRTDLDKSSPDLGPGQARALGQSQPTLLVVFATRIKLG